MHIIEPRYRALAAAKYGTRPCEEAVLLARFQNAVAMTVSLGKRLILFQTEIVALSDTVSRTHATASPWERLLIRLSHSSIRP